MMLVWAHCVKRGLFYGIAVLLVMNLVLLPLTMIGSATRIACCRVQRRIFFLSS